MTTEPATATITRLRDCLHAVAATVPETAPEQTPSTTTPDQQRRRRHWIGPIAAAAAAIVVVGLVWTQIGTSAPPADASVITSAAETTIQAQTARLRFSATPSPDRIGPDETFYTEPAEGVVDFTNRAAKASYPNGFTMIFLDDISWSTSTPNDPDANWTKTIPDADPLRLALRPNTTADALLQALSGNADTVTDLGAATVNGYDSHGYQATIAASWTAEVWITNQSLLTRVVVTSPTGTSTIDYWDYGTPADISAPA